MLAGILDSSRLSERETRELTFVSILGEEFILISRGRVAEAQASLIKEGWPVAESRGIVSPLQLIWNC